MTGHSDLPADSRKALIAFAVGKAASSRAVYLRARRRGRHQRSEWVAPADLGVVLTDWLDATFGERDATLELTLLDAAVSRLHDGHPVLEDRERGLWGFEFVAGDSGIKRLSPNDIITRNTRHAKAVGRLCDRHGADIGQVSACTTRQYLLAHAPHWIGLQRQKAPADERRADATGVATLREGLASWLYRQADRDGRLPYKYWPGNGRYSDADNSIRRLLGVWAMRQHAAHHGTAAQRAIAKRCLHRVITDRYIAHGRYGLISDPHGVKLGALAVAGLALLAAPDHTDATLLDRLLNSTRKLRRNEGAFRTFWWPRARDDNQNFYPGEALLFWAQLYRRRGNDDLRSAIDQSLTYYRRWHHDRPNPAFVPWHTLACCTMYDVTGNTAYLGHVADMNDWLLALQQWHTAPHADMRGRFYLPSRPDFGPPHASSTAIYTESLTAATRALNNAGMTRVANTFARGAQRGLSNLRALQYLEITDLFRFAYPQRVAGALRTEVYDLTVRIDSVAHALHACMAWESSGPR